MYKRDIIQQHIDCLAIWWWVRPISSFMMFAVFDAGMPWS